MEFLLIFLIILAVILILSSFLKRGERELWLPYVRNDAFLTPAEKDFFRVLEYALKDENLRIFPQIALLSLVQVDKRRIRNNSEFYQYFNRISAKRIDYLITTADFDPVLAIELDDRSHQQADRQKRDRFVEMVFENIGLPLLRFPVRRKYNPEEIKKIINTHIKGNNNE